MNSHKLNGNRSEGREVKHLANTESHRLALAFKPASFSTIATPHTRTISLVKKKDSFSFYKAKYFFLKKGMISTITGARR